MSTQGTTCIRKSSFYLTDAIATEHFVNENRFHNNLYLATNYAASQGIPSILIERGGMGDWTYEEVRSTRRDVRNILCHMGIYQGVKDFRTYYPLDVADIRYQDAEENGLWYPFKKVGDMIQEGDILGEVRDYEGNVKEVSVAEFDGVLLYQCGTLQVLGNGLWLHTEELSADMMSAKNVL